MRSGPGGMLCRSEEDTVGKSRLNILVTGGAGFIGSNLCDRLLEKGHRVICIDNLQTGHLSNIRPLINHPRFEFVSHDIRESFEIAGQVDRIYNLACPASPRHYQSDPIGTLKTCVDGAVNILELARRKGARVLQASTSEVYGDPEMHPQSESYLGNVNPIGPRACYDEGKRCAETLFFDYRRLFGLPIKVARIFNTYGPRMLEHDGRVVSNFIIQALRGEPLTLYGNGSQTRSFCYVDDLVCGLELMMESAEHVTGPCNLGNPHEVSVKDIALHILELTGSRSRVVMKPLPEDDPKRRRPDIARATALLGWSPQIGLEDGLRRTIDYFSLKLLTPSAVERSPARRIDAVTSAKRSGKAAHATAH
jgi:UDP-glucuronate decarboxylase